MDLHAVHSKQLNNNSTRPGMCLYSGITGGCNTDVAVTYRSIPALKTTLETCVIRALEKRNVSVFLFRKKKRILELGVPRIYLSELLTNCLFVWRNLNVRFLFVCSLSVFYIPKLVSSPSEIRVLTVIIMIKRKF
jgi:hypothetical protein